MKNLVLKNFIIVLCFLFLSSSASYSKLRIYLKNSSGIKRSVEMVEIPISNLKSKVPLSGNEVYIVKDSKGGIIPSQLTYDGKLIFQAVEVEPKSEKVYVITSGKKIDFERKVGGRLYPERMNDLSFENDKVGFRFYEQEVMKTDGPSNGLDLWVKRTSALILDKWYHEDEANHISYHVDHGEGADFYALGHALGAGAMAPYMNGKLILNDNSIKAEILDNGPLRFTAKLTYPEIEIEGKKYSEVRTVTLDAGSYMLKINQEYGVDKNIPVVAGIIKRDGGGDSVLWNKKNYFIYEEPVSKENGQMYLGVIIPQGIEKVFVNAYDYFNPAKKQLQHYSHVLGLTEYHKGKSLIYYTGYGWDKYTFANVKAFQMYVRDYATRIQNPLRVTCR